MSRRHFKTKGTSIKTRMSNCKTCIAETGFSQGDIADAFPSLSIVSKIILVCPLGTASVERGLVPWVEFAINHDNEYYQKTKLTVCMFRLKDLTL